jgi:hypothetical protein
MHELDQMWPFGFRDFLIGKLTQLKLRSTYQMSGVLKQ